MTEKQAKAMKTVKRFSAGSAVAGFLPVPMLDIAAVTGLQLAMLANLSKQYGIPFSEDRGKALVSSLISGLATPGLGMALGSWIKIVPVVGSVVGSVSIPIFASAATYAVGKVFIQHFESGGTFLDFDPEKVRAHFAEEFQKGAAEASKRSAAA